jgi:hypothetical protein
VQSWSLTFFYQKPRFHRGAILIFEKSNLFSSAKPMPMQTVVLRFTSLSDLTTFSHMLNKPYLLDAEELTLSGFVPKPYISIAQNVFEATLL